MRVPLRVNDIFETIVRLQIALQLRATGEPSVSEALVSVGSTFSETGNEVEAYRSQRADLGREECSIGCSTGTPEQALASTSCSTLTMTLPQVSLIMQPTVQRRVIWLRNV